MQHHHQLTVEAVEQKRMTPVLCVRDLDPGAPDDVLSALVTKVRLDECAVLAATHDLDVAARISDGGALLADGRLTLERVCADDGPPARAPRDLLRAERRVA